MPLLLSTDVKNPNIQDTNNILDYVEILVPATQPDSQNLDARNEEHADAFKSTQELEQSKVAPELSLVFDNEKKTAPAIPNIRDSIAEVLEETFPNVRD